MFSQWTIVAMSPKTSKKKDKDEGIKMSKIKSCARKAAIAAAKTKDNKVDTLYMCRNDNLLLYVGPWENDHVACSKSPHGENFSI